jgi:signal transduction histidine kinase
VLDMAKIEAGEVEWRIGPVDLRAVVEQAAAATSQLFRDKGVALALDLPDALPPVEGDDDRLVQVVVNLLSNAAKFTPDGGHVAVRAAALADGVEVAVADDGPGIAPEHHAAVFERFRQVGDTMTDKPQGTGLGLAICKRIVEHLGGRIGVDSAPGRGATFRFAIPYAAAPAAGGAGQEMLPNVTR